MSRKSLCAPCAGNGGFRRRCKARNAVVAAEAGLLVGPPFIEVEPMGIAFQGVDDRLRFHAFVRLAVV